MSQATKVRTQVEKGEIMNEENFLAQDQQRIEFTSDNRRVTTNTPAFFSNPTTNGKLVEFMLYSQKNGFSDATTNTRYKILRFIARNNANLADPEAVKLFTAKRKEGSNGHKQVAVSSYSAYARMENIQWTPPFYDYDETLPFVPTEKKTKPS